MASGVSKEGGESSSRGCTLLIGEHKPACLHAAGARDAAGVREEGEAPAMVPLAQLLCNPSLSAAFSRL